VLNKPETFSITQYTFSTILPFYVLLFFCFVTESSFLSGCKVLGFLAGMGGEFWMVFLKYFEAFLSIEKQILRVLDPFEIF
jgi:hypothetical protein